MLSTGRRAVRILFVLLLGLNVATLAVRLWFVVISGPLAATTGFEEFSLYNIWKVRHALPLYESPVREPYLLTSYNAAFYHVYAGWARLWKADGAAMVSCVRLLTPWWALAGMLLTVHLLRRLVPETKGGALWVWGLPFLAWFGTLSNGWMALSARPDTAAAALAIGGLVLAVQADESRRGTRWLASSLCFFAAWGFKQSVVWIFAGVALYLLLARRWRELLGLVGPFMVLALLGLAVSSEDYRYNIFVVPEIYQWFPRQSVLLLAQAIVLNPFFWVLAVVAFRSTFKPKAEVRDGQAMRMVAIAAIPPVAMGTVQLALHGSGTNNLFEGFLMIALLGSAEWLRQLDEPASRLVPVGAWLLAAMAPLPVLQLALAARHVPYAEIDGVSIGNVIKLNAAQREQRAQFAAYLETLPSPLWVNDAMLQLPWFANANRYPAYPEDFQFEGDAWRKGVIDGSFVPVLVRQRTFASLLLRPNDGLVRFAKRYGYVEQPLPPGLDALPTEYGLTRARPLLLVRAPRAETRSARK